MSRIHAVIIALVVAASVAFGANAAFEANAAKDAQVGNAMGNITMQARADSINEQERQLAKRLAETPVPDRSPITKVVRVPVATPAVRSSSSSSTRSNPVRDDDDDDDDRDEREHGDDDDGGDDD